MNVQVIYVPDFSADLREKRYLGDGVTVGKDSRGYVWLVTPRDGGEHKICLEPGVYENLTMYVRSRGFTPPELPAPEPTESAPQ